MNFIDLVTQINLTHSRLQQNAVKAVNMHLTIRNWLVGHYIVVFEQKGEDRAGYGEKLLQNLAKNLNQDSLSYRNLKLFRQFYLSYPQIGQAVSAQLQNLRLVSTFGSDFLIDLKPVTIGQTTSAQFQITADKLITKLSFSHLALLLPIKEPLKRVFYEVAAMNSN